MTDTGDYCGGKPRDGGAATSLTLLDHARAGDNEAWERMVFLYGPLVRWWARQKGVIQHDAVEDLIQEVFVAVRKNLPGFAKGAKGSFRAWLAQITQHKIADYYRRRTKEPQAAGGSDARAVLENVPVVSTDGAADGYATTERAILLRRALELVRPKCTRQTWEAVWRVVVDGHSPEEVAADLGMGIGGVYTAKSRVLARLRKQLEDLDV